MKTSLFQTFGQCTALISFKTTTPKSRISLGALVSLLTLAILFAAVSLAPAAVFFTDFSSPPTNATYYGNGPGVQDGVLKLTVNQNSQIGSLVIGDFVGGQPIYGFSATFKLRIGGGTATPADGFSFNFAYDLPNAAFGEEGAGSGLTVSFDTYDNGGNEAPAIDIFSRSGPYGPATYHMPVPIDDLITGDGFADVVIRARADGGGVDALYKGDVIFANVAAFNVGVGRFGLGGRTGGLNDNHWVDDLLIETVELNRPFIKSTAPLGSGIMPDVPVVVEIKDIVTQVDTNSIKLYANGAPVTPTILKTDEITWVTYMPVNFWLVNTTNTVEIVFSDNATPPNTGSNTWQFVTVNLTVIPATFAYAPDAGIDRGFTVRTSQSNGGNNSTGWTEDQLAGRNTIIAQGFDTPQLINYWGNGGRGNFANDSLFPGIVNDNYFALEAVAFLRLNAGIHRMGVNSDDGFRLSVGQVPGQVSVVLGEFNGGRGVADTQFDFLVETNGLFAFRLTFEEGAGGYACEWFSVDRVSGNRTLINDTNVPNAIVAFRTVTGLTNPFQFTQQPQDVSVNESDRATFNITVASATATNPVTVRYQWQTSGVDIAGANNPTYTTPVLKRSEDQTKVRCIVTLLGYPPLVSQDAILTVVPDTQPPQVVSAATLLASTMVGVRFDELLDPASVTNAANYRLSHGATVTSASLRPDGKSLALTVTGFSYTNFNLIYNDLRDLAGNVVPTNATATVKVLSQVSHDISTPGDPAEPGSTYTCAEGEFDVVAGGSDIWNTQDHFHFVYEAKEGDFDVQVQLTREDQRNTWTKAGLMVRENLSPGSRNLKVAANPPQGANSYEVHIRSQQDGGTGPWPGLANNGNPGIPNAWMRLKRAGDLFTAYRGPNGTDWVQMAQITVQYPRRVYLGLGTSSVNNSPGQATVAWYRNYKDAVGTNAPMVVPDLLIKKASEPDTAFAADGVYQIIPTGEQVESQITAPNVAAIYQVKLENDSAINQAFVLKAIESSEPGWTTVYSLGASNITSQLLGAGLLITNLAPGQSQIISIAMTPGRRAPGGGTKTVTIRVLLDNSAPVIWDAVAAITKVINTIQPDMLVRREFDLNYIGNDIYSDTGAGQTKSLEVDAGTQATYFIQVSNDGNIPQQFRLTGTPGNKSWAVNYFATGCALRFDGGDDFVNLGNWSPGNQWTVEAWVKPSATPNGRRTIAGGVSQCRDWGITMQDGQFGVVIQPPGGCTTTIRSGVPVEPGKWYHVAGVCDAAKAFLFVNGELLNSAPSANYVGTADQVRVGGEVCCGGNNFPGLIDEVRIWNRPLNTNEIRAAMIQRIAGAEPGLLGYWQFDERAGNTVIDLSTNAHNGTLVNGAAWETELGTENKANDITSFVTSTGWTNIFLAPNTSQEFIVVVTPYIALPGGSALDVLVTGVAIDDTNRADTVKLATSVFKTSTTPEGANYTTSADFEQGRLVGVEYVTVPDQLQLTKESVTLPFIWVPNSNEGTVSKVDTRTGRELGRYRTGPGSNGQPSRTTVDQQGNCWVANRQTATVVKIGLYENGQYLDRNSDGLVQTSHDLNGDGLITGGEILAWGQDECVLYEVILIPGKEGTFTPGTYLGDYANDYWNPGPRGIAVDAKGSVWIGTHDTKKFYYLDGNTAKILRTIDVSPVDHTSYGALIDAQGILWSSGNHRNHVLRLNPTDNTFSVVPLGHWVYGVGIDRNNHLFATGVSDRKISRINVLTGAKEWTVSGYYGRGVAVTDDGDFWTPDSEAGTVTRWSNDGVLKATIPVGPDPTGVAVDAAGKVWVVNNGNEFIKRIDPATDSVDLAKALPGTQHYGYSDMTGIISRTATTRLGVWSVIHNAKVLNSAWDVVSWHGEDATGSNIVVRVRSSNDRRQWSAWETAVNGSPLAGTPPGQYLEMEVTMHLRGDEVAPILYDIAAKALPPADVDLQVLKTASPSPALSEHKLTYSIVITNHTAAWASGIVVTDTLPAGVELVSVNVPNGSYQKSNDVLVCRMGGIPGKSSAIISVVVIPPMPGLITNTANVTQNGTDPNPKNNQTALVTTVLPPQCAPPPMGLVGWWPGNGNALDLIKGNDGVVQGGTAFIAAKVNQGFSFDSDDDRVVIPHAPCCDVRLTGFTADFWMKGSKNQPQSLAAIVDKSHGYVDSTGWAFQVDSNRGTVGLGIGAGGGGAGDFRGVGSVVDVLDGRFHHVAGTWDGAAIRLYVDGVLQGVTPLSAPANNSRALNIGFAWGNNSPQRFFRGLVDELEIFDRALSEEEIQAIYDSRSAGKCADTLIINAPLEFPGAVVGRYYEQAISAALGTPPYDFALTSGNLPPGLSLSDRGLISGVPTQSGDFTFAIQASDSADRTASTVYTLSVRACVPPPDGLIGWWSSEGNADDNIGGNHGSLVNGVTFVQGKAGQAFSLDGVNDVIRLPGTRTGILDITTNKLTVEAWIYLPLTNQPPSGGQTIFDKYWSGNQADGYVLHVGKGYLGMNIGTVSNRAFSIAFTNEPLPLKTWLHVAGTYDGNTARLYVNGVEKAAAPLAGNILHNDIDAAIGNDNGGSPDYGFVGFIDEVQVYQRALSADELKAIVNASFASKCLPNHTDLLIKNVGEDDAKYGIDNLYMPVPADGQVRAQTVEPLATASYAVKLQNDSNTNRTFVLRAMESPEGLWSVVYKSGTSDIGSLIRSAAGYVVSNLVSGGSQTITVEMTPGQRVPGGTTKSATVNVFWDKNAAAVRDAVQAITTCLITRQPDLSIRREIDLNYLGIGVYNSTGADQTRTLEVEVGQTAVYLLQLRNAGNVPNRFVLTGTSSGNGWSVKYYGSKQYLRLDGADDYIDFGNWFNYNTYTIALWLKTGSSQVTYADIMDNNHRGGINWVIQQNEGQVNRFYVGLSDGNPGLPMVNLVANRWQHLAVTRDTNRLNSVYLDGVLLGSAKGAGPMNYDGNQFLRLGRWGGGGRNWNGAIDELHIWNRALNAEEISADWANTLTPESSGTMGFWRFDEGTGNVVHDASANGRHGTLVNGPAWVSAFDQLSDRTDISAQITGAGYATMLLGPGAVVEFMVEVTPNASVPGGAAKEVIVTATSMADRTKLDTVKAVTVLAKPSTVAEGGTYTSNADFDKNARMVGVEHTTVPDQLQLTRESFTFPFIWVPNSNEGTVSKVDTRTGRELGRYRTGPQSGANPSRTTVDLKGNCWVGNRQTATAVKIGLLENGQYNDRNGNGIIETSQDLNGDGDITGPELLPWGQDECVLFEVALLPGQEKTYVPGTPGVPYGNDYWNPGTRGFAVDPKDNVWVGTYATKKFYYIDGKTGQILKTIDVGSVNHTSYGATMSTDGIVWSAGSDKRHVLKLNPTDGSFTTININHHVYGIAPDKNNHLFVSGWQETKLSRINMTNNTVEWTVQGIYESRGVAVTDDGDVWVANSGPGTVARWSNNGVLKTTIPVGNQPTGVAVDAAGKVWVVNVGDEYIHRIDPETDSVDLSKRLLGATHYGYSDMTGIIARSATTRIGFWSVIHNAKLINTPWGVVSWHSLEPEGTSIKVRVRSSNDQETWSLWETAYNGEWLHATPPGKYLEVEATLQTFTGDLSPVLYDLTILPASSIDLGKEIYSNDFQEIIGSEWSNPNTDLTPRANRRFLGQFNNQTVSLTLTNLPPHAAVSVLFDLFVIRSWDGNGQETTANFGPDVWGVNVAGGLQLLNTTFNNAPSNNAAAGQAYPEAYPGGLHTPLAGAAETNTLGYVYTNENRIMDSVYRLGYTFPHSADRLALNFFATGLNTNVFEESWGLDNVRVFITPIALPLRLAPLGHSTNGFRLQLQGEPQLTCILQATTNLVSWQDISTNTLVSNKLDLIDTEATKFKRRFYRALQYP